MRRLTFRNHWFATFILVFGSACGSTGTESTGATVATQSTETVGMTESTETAAITESTETSATTEGTGATATTESTDTLSCVDSTGDSVVMGCDGISAPEPARDDAVQATINELGALSQLELAWYSETLCCFSDVKVTASLPNASLVPGVHMIEGMATDWSGCNPSGSGPMMEIPLLAIEIVEVTDTCVSGRFFEEEDGSGEPGYGFVATR